MILSGLLHFSINLDVWLVLDWLLFGYGSRWPLRLHLKTFNFSMTGWLFMGTIRKCTKVARVRDLRPAKRLRRRLLNMPCSQPLIHRIALYQWLQRWLSREVGRLAVFFLLGTKILLLLEIYFLTYWKCFLWSSFVFYVQKVRSEQSNFAL